MIKFGTGGWRAVIGDDFIRENIQRVVAVLEEHQLQAHLSTGKQVTIIGVIGDKTVLTDTNLELLEGVDKLVPITETYKLTNKKFNPEPSVFRSSLSCSEPMILLSLPRPSSFHKGFSD